MRTPTALAAGLTSIGGHPGCAIDTAILGTSVAAGFTGSTGAPAAYAALSEAQQDWLDAQATACTGDCRGRDWLAEAATRA